MKQGDCWAWTTRWCAISLLGSLLVVVGRPATARAQSLGIAPHVGTLGVGIDIATAPSDRVSLRGGVNFFPFDVDFTASDVDLTLDLPSPQLTALLDLFLVGGVRLSGGLLISRDDVNLRGDFGGSVNLGGTTYTASEVGSLSGAIVTNEVSPYVGFGIGKVASRGVGFLLDLGVAFQGRPRVGLTADGPITSLPSFLADLEAERQAIEDDVELFRYYPVLSVGLSIGVR
ncbi:MAG: hypothetical protein ACE5HP_09710 [Gemmatimonadota bacterium]